jgi:hypothetical protein
VQTRRVGTPSSAAFFNFLQQRTYDLLGQPWWQLPNRSVCLIERGHERRGPDSPPERQYRLVYGDRGAKQLINHADCSDSEA